MCLHQLVDLGSKFCFLGSSRGKFFVVWLGVDGLDDADVSGLECGFAVFEIVVPFADEGVIESLLFNCW